MTRTAATPALARSIAAARDAARVLAPGTVYIAHDRFVCSDVACCGYTALYTGRTVGGAKLLEVTAADVAEWAASGMGDLTCECGALNATALLAR